MKRRLATGTKRLVGRRNNGGDRLAQTIVTQKENSFRSSGEARGGRAEEKGLQGQRGRGGRREGKEGRSWQTEGV